MDMPRAKLPTTESKVNDAVQSTKWDTDQWRKWLTKRLGRRLGTFHNEPEEMIAAFERERASIDQYRGREVLELLQNADDAGVGYGRNRALIRFWPEGLCVANSGVPFSAAGVGSLIISHLSPKKLDRSRYIGNRGLGFRSVLAWSTCPLILSGNLHLAFSASLAASSLKRLTDESDEVRRKVEERKQTGDEMPVPLLSFPAVLDAGTMRDPGKDDRWSIMWERAAQLRRAYDTVVALPFADSGAAELALEELRSLSPELLLFLQNLTEIAIETPEKRSVWHASRDGEWVTVTAEPEGQPARRWRIVQKKGTIPESLLTAGLKQTPGYEIRLALCDEKTEPGFLYNYFPSNVRFPYPVVAHATMELTDNRQNLLETQPNRYLAERLAEALAEVAEQSADPSHPWRAMEILASRGTGHDPVLEKLGFVDALQRAAKNRRIVPTRDSRLVRPDEARHVPVDVEGWLPLRGFGDVVPWTEEYDVKEALKWLGVREQSADEFLNRVQDITGSLTLDERAALLAGVVRNRQHEFVAKAPCSALLVDESRAPIESEMEVYLPPLSGAAFDLPAWVPMRFLSGQLVEKAMMILKYSRERLVAELRESGFTNVHEYDFRSVIRAVVARAADRCQEAPERTDEIRAECVRALMGIWRAAGRRDAPAREESLHVLVPTRGKEWKAATGLYLGAPYPRGVLMEALLGNLHPELFAASPDAFGPEHDAGDWQDFLLWLGVADLPREKTVTCEASRDQEYLDHVRRTVHYPIDYQEFGADSPEKHRLSSARVAGIEYLDDMLEQADPHALLAWIAEDERIRNWRNHGDTAAKLEARFRDRTYRYSSSPLCVPSYVLWMIQRKAWLPTASSERRPPSECVWDRIAAEELQGIFPRPVVDPQADIFGELRIDREAVRESLRAAGVHMRLDDFTWEQVYAVMLRLPELDPEGKAATRVYKVIGRKAEDEEQGPSPGSAEEEFRRDGKIWACVKGKLSYVPVASGVYFRGDATIPKAVADYYPVVDLPRRGGIEKIARVFGVKVLRSKDIKITIDQHDTVPGGEEMNDELHRLKPYILAVRLDSNPTVAGLAQFRELTVVPCTHVRGRANVEGQEVDISVGGAGESIIAGEVAYLVVHADMRRPFLQDVMAARQVANVLAEVLGVEQASDFAYLARAGGAEERTQVLSDILGHDAVAILSKAKETLQMETDSDREAAEAWEPIPTGVAGQQPATAEQPGALETVGAPVTETTALPVPEQVQAKAEERKPAEAKGTVERRVLRAKPSTREQVQGTRRVTDGDRCEDLAERFEESQGRFPLRVSAIQGAQGFGCDIVSFATAEDREQFKGSGGRNIQCVRRFIEVKGRSSEKGTVPLEGNELEAARNRRDKYYIYRVYEVIPNQKWEVVELADPFDHEWRVSYQVDPFRCQNTKYWTVTPVERDRQEMEPDTGVGTGEPASPKAVPATGPARVAGTREEERS